MRIHAGIAAGITVVANAVLVLTAASDKSWGALGIAIMIGPLANLLLSVVFACCIPMVKRMAGGAPMTTYWIAGVTLPLLAIPADLMVIASMGIHGC